ncbi:hypothetical protein FA13DRAFT_1684064 [Coprinellus micaceus]|uniref:Glycerophosphocholine acyltransferase 1 n=1 Tax=Coprinellus micaceus TaxID=71717 RepID=A0A4Y7TPH4_COPMI|nr:hypothetical protein FA13DRAFT_1684064 [Coprinellus micaceus]
MGSTPPSPPMPRGYLSVPFERFIRDDGNDQWASAFTLLDTLETYFDSHVDLLQRKLQKHSDRLKMKAEEKFKIKDLSGDLLAENLEREIKNVKLKAAARMSSFLTTWQSAQVVRTREKLSFFFGVSNLLFTALMFGLAPQWVHISYTVQGLYLLPLRFYQYKKRDWHYFLFDLCYFVTILNFVYFWIFPSSTVLFIACYCLSHGSLASAVITWRNSLVFHDQDKITSLFIHIYAPLAFTVIRHFYPGAEERFPALQKVEYLSPLKAIFISGGIYLIWQLLYWKFLLIDRKQKIESGQRTTSFSFLLNDKRSVIGRTLSSVPEQWRLESFIAGQLVYAIFTEIPAIFLLYKSPTWSAIFLLFIFSVSAWNGGGFYIEVFGRKFEKEVEALRKELAEATSRSNSSGSASPGSISQTNSEAGSTWASPDFRSSDLPSDGEQLSVPDLDLSSNSSDSISVKKNT